jgi:hypothetical protein
VNNWIKNLFWKEAIVTDINGLPSGNDIIPMPEVKPTRPEKNISEPVLSFVDCVRDNPQRFSVQRDFIYTITPVTLRLSHQFEDYRCYRIKDKHLNLGWFIAGRAYSNPSFYMQMTKNGIFQFQPALFLTNDEKFFIVKELTKIFQDRQDRKDRLDKLRKERHVRDERNRLKEIYCK